MDVLIKRDQVVHDLSQAITRGDWSLESVPALLERVIREDMWKERLVEVTGEIKKFKTWDEFVQAGPPEGLGTTHRTLEHLCQDHDEVLGLLEEVSKRPTGRPARESVHNVNNKRPAGNAAAQALRRLRKDRPDLHAQVVAGEITGHAAMIAAGFRHKTITVPVDVDSAERALRRHFSDEDLRLLAKRLVGHG